jgi:hypothetical protein
MLQATGAEFAKRHSFLDSHLEAYGQNVDVLVVWNLSLIIFDAILMPTTTECCEQRRHVGQASVTRRTALM